MMSLITIAEDEGLSGGQIAGIVVGCVVMVPIAIHVLAAVISLVNSESNCLTIILHPIL